MTVTAALSDYMGITTYRENELQSKTIEFIYGNVKDHPIEKIKPGKHGLSTTIIPSEKYLGKMELTYDLVEDYLRNLSYVMPDYITTHYYREDENGKKTNHIIYKNNEGLSACTKFLSASLEVEPINVRVETPAFDIEVAFSYDKTVNDMLTQSFANAVITREDGTHVTACQRAICEFFAREAKKLDPTNKFEVVYDDCRRGLVMAVNCNHDNPILEGNSKSKLGNPDVLKDGKGLIQRELGNYFSDQPALLRKVITYLRQISKIRQESNKIKGISTKKDSSFTDDAEIPFYYPVAERNRKGHYKELLISEGVSALGALQKCRNPEYQAIFGLTGVTDNVYGLSLTQLMEKKVFRNLLKVLGCGAGTAFRLSDLKYNKIIIASDSDVDGSNITSLLFCFFLLFTPELITSGKIYKALPPLYMLKDSSLKRIGQNPSENWLYDKLEYYEMTNKVIAKNCEVILETSSSKEPMIPLDKKGVVKWLNDNAEYDLELDALSKKSACNTTILEHVCYYKVLSKGNEAKFREMITKAFPEMTYDQSNCALIGSWNGEFFSLICDSIFMSNARRFINKMTNNPSIFIKYRNRNNPDAKFTKTTVGEFLFSMNRLYSPTLEQRFKGLGEIDAIMLFTTTMNPKIRRLLRVTMTDVKRTLSTFEMIHGRGEQMIKARRKYLDELDISYADIDN